MPGGHREKCENIFDTAERELYEETGAILFKLKKMSAYSVVREDLESFGMLYFANIDCFGALPDSEMDKVIFCDKIPEALTYPLIQPKLMEFVQQKLREEFLLIEEEIPLNKEAIIRGEKVLLLSFIKANEEKKLLVLYKKEQSEEDESYGREFQTNREEQLAGIKCHKGFRHLGIQSITFQEQQVILKSSSVRGLSYYKEQDYQLYTYFKEKGFIVGEWLNCSMEQLILAEYRLDEDETLPTMHLNENLEMILKTRQRSKLVDVQHPLKVSIGKVDTNTKIYYFDEATQEE